MKLRFTVSEPDVLALSENFYRSSPIHRKSRQSSRLYLPIVLTPLMLLFIYSFGFSLVPISIFLAAMILWYAFYPLHFDKRLRNHAQKQLQESSFSNVFGVYDIELRDDHLISSGPTGDSRLNWDSIHRTEITDEYLFVFFSGPTGIPISISQIGIELARKANNEINRYRKKAG